MDVVVLGHSFVRRLRDGLIPPWPSNRGRDIGIGSLNRASLLSRKFNISRHVGRVYTFSDGVVRIGDIARAQHFIDQIAPGILLIDIGSNDLARIDVVDPLHMLRLATSLTDMALTFCARKVIFNAILPRTGNITCTPETFRANAEHFNTYLMNICDPRSKLVYHQPRGFWTSYADSRNDICAVSAWSTDVIHCDNPDSFRRYMARTRRAILSQVHWAKE
jgi:hypothetical protein